MNKTTAIILNSGTGSRMKELTVNNPKCLIKITETDTILSRQLDLLGSMGITDIVLTTGPFEEKIKEHVHGRFKHLKISFVHNPLYNKTNYIYSLLLAGDMIDNNVLLIHGDLVFDSATLKRLFDTAYEDAVLVNKHVPLPEKDFKAQLGNNGLVEKIGVDIYGDNSVFMLPLYRLGSHFFKIWLREMKLFAEKGKLQVYAENALNRLLGELKLYPVDIGSGFCMEIDDIEDLKKAKGHLKGKREI